MPQLSCRGWRRHNAPTDIYTTTVLGRSLVRLPLLDTVTQRQIEARPHWTGCFLLFLLCICLSASSPSQRWGAARKNRRLPETWHVSSFFSLWQAVVCQKGNPEREEELCREASPFNLATTVYNQGPDKPLWERMLCEEKEPLRETFMSIKARKRCIVITLKEKTSFPLLCLCF